MKLNSKYFDTIRINPEKAEAEPVTPDVPECQWKGCQNAGEHRAPKGRAREGEFFLFCSAHVRQYNASYNYFEGMKDVEIESFQREAAYGHRPTWKLGENAWAAGKRDADGQREGQGNTDERASNAQNFHAFRAKQAREAAKNPKRRLKPLEKKAMKTLGLGESSELSEIKTRYKMLVKRHHPDANGGDRGSEDQLREIIQAYNYLKQAGLV